MLSEIHKSFLIAERSYISSAKREITKLADSLGFGDEQKGKIDIIISELTSNLIKHNAVEGELLVKPVNRNNRIGIEILCLDNGPGMRDLKRMMEDGTSTYGSKGEGMGAIKRLSDEFDIYTLFGMGTFILSRVYLKSEQVHSDIKPKKKNIEIQSVMVAKSGETLCGDAWAYLDSQEQFSIFAGDGLGHGKDANAASEEAAGIFRACLQCIPSDLLKVMHATIKKSRGIVGSIANINFANQTLTYCGIGNIAGRLSSKNGSKNLLSYNGTIGHNIPNTIHNHVFKWEPMSTLVLHSDGLSARWDWAKYPGLDNHDTSLMAAVLYKTNTRKTDDALVIVVRS